MIKSGELFNRSMVIVKVVPWKEVGNTKPVTLTVFALDEVMGMFKLAGLGFVMTKVPFSLVAITVIRKVSPPAGNVPNTKIERVAMLLGAVITRP